jgi:GNAT superfamily N-acetyltransferase
MEPVVKVSRLTLGDLAECAAVDMYSELPHRRLRLQDFLAFYDGRLRGGFAAWFHERMIGFVLYEADPSRRELELVRFGAAAGWELRHVGRRLLRHVAQWLRTTPDVELWMLAHERELRLQCFLRDNGFRAIRILRRYCDGGANDAYLFQSSAERLSLALNEPLQEPA